MKVWVDGSVFENKGQIGVWRVFYEVMTRTASQVDYTLWIRSEPKQPIPKGVRVFRDYGRAEVARLNLPARLRRHIANRSTPRQLHQADLFHSTGFTVPKDAKIKSLITVYDLIAESHFAIGIKALEEAIPVKRTTMERACLLPCISQATMDELSAFYPHLASRARVIPLGADHLDVGCTTETKVLSQSLSVLKGSEYALYIGNRHGYKNFTCVLDAMRHPQWPSLVKLAVVGKPFSDAERNLVTRLGLGQHIDHLGQISDAELSFVYRSVRCLIFPSLQEGFGLPNLEAHRLECPLVCSDIPVFREVAGTAALFFDPRICEQLAMRVRELETANVRERLTESGVENLDRFRWDECGEKMVAIYEEACSL